MKMRLLSMGLLLVTLTMLLAACGSDDPTATPTTSSQPDAPTATPTDVPEGVTPPAPTATSTPRPPTPTPVVEVTFDAAEYFDGKTVVVQVAFSPGGGFDFFARAIAKHMPGHMPGNPTMIVQNRPGAGGIVMMNNFANNVKADGFVLGTNTGNLTLNQVIGQEGIKFDFVELEAVGVVAGFTNVCWLRTDLGVTSWDELFTRSEPAIFAQTIANKWMIDLLIEELGVNIKALSGFQGTADTTLAVEQGEADGMCWPWTPINGAKPDWAERDFIIPLLQYTTGTTHADLPDLTTLLDYKDQMSDLGWSTMAAGTVSETINRLYFLPPGTPVDIVNTYRTAFWDTVNDPAFIADADRAGRAVGPIHGDDTAPLIQEAMNISQEVKDNLTKLLGG
jgi:tripartite-type tricarboxylate transporter receptor subunit TctC